MPKLSRSEAHNHNEALRMLEKDVLSYEEKIFVLENYHEGATNMNGLAGAFFTPLNMARNFANIYCANERIIDLCAGIGSLAFHIMEANKWEEQKPEITCIEINPEYVEVGKKIVPEATWICGNVLDDDLLLSLGSFFQAVSNPPFGNVKTQDDRKNYRYTGSQLEYKVIEQASKIAKYGAFILPQMSVPWKYSGVQGFKNMPSAKYEQFNRQTGIEFEDDPCIDTTALECSFKQVDITVEFITVDFQK